MRIRILSPCFVAGKVYRKGDEIDVSDKDAREVIGVRRAEVVIEKKDESATADEQATEGGRKKRGGKAE